MNISFRGIGFSVTDEDREFLEKKLRKMAFAEEYLQDLEVTAKKESKGIGFHLEAFLHFSWKKEKAVSQD